MPKLVKTKSRQYKSKDYERWTISIPKDIIQQLGWHNGIGLNLFASAGVLQIVPMQGFVTKTK